MKQIAIQKGMTPFFIIAALLLVYIFLSGTAPVFAAEKAEKVNYRLKWLFNASVVGDLYADEAGIFKKYGLDVNIKEGGPERDAIKELEIGYAKFGVASADQVVRALSKGSPVVVVAQLFQINPLQWIYRKKVHAIKSLSDLKGKKIGITFGGNDETIMKTLLIKGNISEKAVSFFSVRFDYTPFYQKKVDIWPVYRNAQGPILKRKLEAAKESVAFFNPADYGVQFVANSVVTSKKILKKNPKLVQNFRKALLEAWELAFDEKNRARSLKMLQKFDKDSSIDILTEQFDLTKSMIKPDKTTAIGTIDVVAWEQTESIMLEQKVIKKPVNIKRALMGSF